MTQKSNSYALSTGKKDLERLILLNEIHNPASLRLLEAAPGMRVLTIGCGIGLLEVEIAQKVTPGGLVLATDLHKEQLKIAEKFKEKHRLSQLQFSEVDALDIEKVPGLFDRIHCRFVLTHLPLEQGFQITKLLHKKIAPGGFLLLEEFATMDSLFCDPAHLGYDKWKVAAQKQFALQGSDFSPGKNIFRHLQEKGYAASYTSYQPILSTSREKSLLSMGILSVAEKFLEKKLTTSEEIEETLFLLHKLEQDPNSFPRYNEVSQIKVSLSR